MFGDNQILLQINVTGDANTVVTQLTKNIQGLDGVSSKTVKKMKDKERGVLQYEERGSE